MSSGDLALFPALGAPDDHVAIRLGDRTLTRRELAAHAIAHADALDAAGVCAGDRVAIVTSPCVETVVALVGHAIAGIVSVPVNPGIGSAELEHVLRDATPRTIVSASPDELAPRVAGREVRAIRLATGAAAGTARTGVVSDEPLLVLYTSGTTGLPKGAVLTARNVASNLDALARAWRVDERDTIVHALPLFHVHGLVLGLFGALRAGATLEWHDRFEPARIAGALSRTRGVLYAVPTMHHRLADAAETDDAVRAGLRAARLLVSGSAPLSAREHARLAELAGQRVLERYGLTETIIDCAMRAGAATAIGTVGPAVDGVEVVLVDDDRHPTVPRDACAIGEVAVRGPNVFAGYLGRPDATRAVLDERGFFYTGDLATMTVDGVIRIVGRRATDLIKTGGFKVGAGEVEAALLEHPDVREAAVLGAPDDDLGERIVAWVVPREGTAPAASALTEHVAALLSKHKRPRDVHLVHELPRNAMGKVLKSALRARASEGGRS